MNKNTFLAGATVPIWAHIKDWEGTATTPDNGVTVTITDPDGDAQITTEAMTEDSEGELVYYFPTTVESLTGWWNYMCVGQDGAGDDVKYTRQAGSFKLI